MPRVLFCSPLGSLSLAFTLCMLPIVSESSHESLVPPVHQDSLFVCSDQVVCKEQPDLLGPSALQGSLPCMVSSLTKAKSSFLKSRATLGLFVSPPFPLDFALYHLMVTAACLPSSKMPLTDSSLLVVSSRAPHLLAWADICVKNPPQGTPEIWTAPQVIALSGEAWGIYRLPEEPKLCMQLSRAMKSWFGKVKETSTVSPLLASPLILIWKLWTEPSHFSQKVACTWAAYLHSELSPRLPWSHQTALPEELVSFRHTAAFLWCQ